MKTVKLVVGTSIVAGTLLFSNNVADASLNKEKLTDAAVKAVIKNTSYKEGDINHTEKITDKGDFYEIPVYQTNGVGGLKIIKINKENGAIQYGDNDLKDFESAGSLNLDNYED